MSARERSPAHAKPIFVCIFILFDEVHIPIHPHTLYLVAAHIKCINSFSFAVFFLFLLFFTLFCHSIASVFCCLHISCAMLRLNSYWRAHSMRVLYTYFAFRLFFVLLFCLFHHFRFRFSCCFSFSIWFGCE